MTDWFKKTDHLGNVAIVMVRDGVTSFVPYSEANTDYQAYLAWVAEGNTAEEWSPENAS